MTFWLATKRGQAATVSAFAGGIAYTDPEVYVPTFFGSCFKAEVSMAQLSEVLIGCAAIGRAGVKKFGTRCARTFTRSRCTPIVPAVSSVESAGA